MTDLNSIIATNLEDSIDSVSTRELVEDDTRFEREKRIVLRSRIRQVCFPSISFS